MSIVEIPQNIFESSNSLVYSLYESPNLFQVVPPTNDSEIDVEVDTMVVGFTLLDKENNPDMQNLSDPVVLTFKSIRAETGMVRIYHYSCVERFYYVMYLWLYHFLAKLYFL